MDDLIANIRNGHAVSREFDLEGIKTGLVLQIGANGFAAKGNFQLPTHLAEARMQGTLKAFTLRSLDLVLEGCLFGKGRFTVSTLNGTTTFSGLILPNMVWAGSLGMEDFGDMTQISATDNRLGTLFALPTVEHVDVFHAKYASYKAVSPDGEQFWHTKTSPKFEATAHNGNVSVILSRQLKTSSGQSGYSKSEVRHAIQVTSKSDQSVENMLNAVADVEDAISVLSGDAFRFQRISVFEPISKKSSDLIWHSSRVRSEFRSPEWHALIKPNLPSGDFEKLLKYIFNLKEEERISLFQLIASMRALGGTERFLAVSQSFEIMARIYPPRGGRRIISKPMFKSAISAAKATLSEYLDVELVDRLGNLMMNSNRESPRGSMERMMAATAKHHSWKPYRPIKDTAKEAINTRNTLVHMGAKAFEPLNNAAIAAHHLGVELQFWAMLHMLMRAGIKADPNHLLSAVVNREGGHAAYMWSKTNSKS